MTRASDDDDAIILNLPRAETRRRDARGKIYGASRRARINPQETRRERKSEAIKRVAQVRSSYDADGGAGLRASMDARAEKRERECLEMFFNVIRRGIFPLLKVKGAGRKVAF